MDFGSKERFAISGSIECVDKYGPYGWVYLWIDGQQLGDGSMFWLDNAADELEDSIQLLTRPDAALLPPLTAQAVLDSVYTPAEGLSQRNRWRCLIDGEGFDGWCIILMGPAVSPTLAWRQCDEPDAHVFALREGEYESAVRSFKAWLQSEKRRDSVGEREP